MRKPHEVNVNVDSDLDLESLTKVITSNVIAGYLMLKGFKTLCNAFEHIIVTKIK